MKVNTAGVIPVIFASSLMSFPGIILALLGKSAGTGIGGKIITGLSSSSWCNPQQPVYSLGLLLYIVLVVFFAYFYTSITFNPLEIADNMKKQGGFIPGIRPGRPTSDYLTKILNYIIFVGAIGLIIVCVVPILLQWSIRSECIFRRNIHHHRSRCCSGDHQADRISDGSTLLQGLLERLRGKLLLL